MEGAKCPICKSNVDVEQSPSNLDISGASDSFKRDFNKFKCLTCGPFYASSQAVSELKDSFDKDMRSRISSFVREREIRKQLAPVFISSSESEQITTDVTAESGRTIVGVTAFYDALAHFPTTVQDRLDRTLLNLAEMGKKPGDDLSLNESTNYPIAFAEDPGVFRFLLQQLDDEDLIGYIPTIGADAIHIVNLTVKGWNRVAELQKARPGSKSKQAFVAMWFSPEGREEREQGLKNGITNAGYEPYIVDDDEYTGKIDDRIIAELRKSRFVVADFTGQRQNVYFEGGFAEGLGIDVIYTCSEKNIKQCHFDKRQENIIVWKDAGDLAERLQRRIEAVIGPAPD